MHETTLRTAPAVRTDTTARRDPADDSGRGWRLSLATKPHHAVSTVFRRPAVGTPATRAARS
jgi:hypothetical protein